MTVEIEDKGGNCGSIGMGNGTWFTILDIPGVENLFNTRKTNDPIDCTRSKARKLADLIEAWEPPDHWFTGIGKSEGKALLIAFLRNCKAFALTDTKGASAPFFLIPFNICQSHHRTYCSELTQEHDHVTNPIRYF